MKTLLNKEIKLVLHPTSLLFLLLSAMLLIPNYPYYVTFFYTCLGIFFCSLGGRENHDIYYTLCMPVRKSDMVKARFCFIVLLETMQMLLAIPFAVLRNKIDLTDNQVGTIANISFFAFSLVMLGLFNFFFLKSYFKNPDKVGSSFGKACVIISLYVVFVEAGMHVVPLMRDRLNTRDPQDMGLKITALAIGLLLYVILTVLSYKKSVKTFSELDL